MIKAGAPGRLKIEQGKRVLAQLVLLLVNLPLLYPSAHQIEKVIFNESCGLQVAFFNDYIEFTVYSSKLLASLFA